MYMERLSNATAAGLLCAFVALLWAAPATAATVPNNFSDSQVVADLEMPTDFAFLPDGRILVIEQWTAKVRLIVNGAIGSNDPLVTVPNVRNDHGEAGLMCVEVDAGWPARPYLYLYYNNSSTDTCCLSMYTVTGDLDNPNSDNLSIAPSSRYDILTDIPDAFPNQNGGTARFGNDGMLYLSLGDDLDECECQETDSLYGEILRLDMSSMPGSGSGPPPKADITPADNPFSGDENTNMVFCYGLRNPYRFEIDPVTGDLIIGDVGEANYEEMNIASGGENFGWPFREGPMIRTPAGCDEPGGPGGTEYDQPIHSYDRVGFSASVISCGMYRPVDFPNDDSFPSEYNGDIFYCEYYQGYMVRLKYNGTNWEVADPVAGQPSADHWATDISEVSRMQVGPDGALWYLDQFDPAWPESGGLRRIVYTGPSQPEARIVTGPGPAETNNCLVRVWNPDSPGVALAEWPAYGVEKYGVNVAVCDTNNDGLSEVLTGAGPGAVFGPHVRGFGMDGTPVPGFSYLAYGTNKYGVNVAAGDIDNDGYDEIVTGAGPGAVFGPHVRGWNRDGSGTPTAIAGISYFAYGTPKWGVNVNCGDIDGDGFDEIVTGAGPGTVYGPHVRGWNYDGNTIAAMSTVSFLAYGTNQWGVNAACGDIDGDGIDEIITGPGPGTVFGAHIRGWNYDGGTVTAIGGVSFFAYTYPDARYGAKVVATDLDGDGTDELLTTPGPDPGWPALVKAWNVDGGTATAIGSIDFDAYGDHGYLEGGTIAGGIGY